MRAFLWGLLGRFGGLWCRSADGRVAELRTDSRRRLPGNGRQLDITETNGRSTSYWQEWGRYPLADPEILECGHVDVGGGCWTVGCRNEKGR